MATAGALTGQRYVCLGLQAYVWPVERRGAQRRAPGREASISRGRQMRARLISMS